jgi:hypothetical protein
MPVPRDRAAGRQPGREHSSTVAGIAVLNCLRHAGGQAPQRDEVAGGQWNHAGLLLRETNGQDSDEEAVRVNLRTGFIMYGLLKVAVNLRFYEL